MDMNKIMSMAKKNQNAAANNKKIGYSTLVKAPKKLEKTVNPDAIKALLNRKKEIEKMQESENLVKKKQLQKLREEKKSTKKAKAMATRTKDNLKIYHSQRQPQKEKSNEVVLTPEAEKQHKAFMKKLMTSTLNEASASSDEGGGTMKSEKKAFKKSEKYQKKARKAATLDFNGLLNLAQEQAQKSSESSDSSSEEESSEEMSLAERLEEEKRKRKELELQLKAMKRKTNHNGQMNSEPYLKIGKLDKGLSEEAKQAKVRAIMAKFKKKSTEKNGIDKSTERRKESSPKIISSKKLHSQRKEVNSKTTSSENRLTKTSKSSASLSKSKNTTHAKTDMNKKLSLHQSNQTFSSKSKPATKVGLSSTKQSTNSLSTKTLQEKTIKKVTNPYAELMQKAKANTNKVCTLSVTNSVVRTNYPGVAQTDPKRPNYQKVAPSQEMIEAYKRRRLMHQQQVQNPRRTQVLRDDPSDDEYDSEMEGFIDDDEEEVMSDGLSMEIGKIFGYDRTKYGRESEYELSKMDASYKDIEKEEKRSLRIAQKEDALEAKRLQEEEDRKRKRLKK